MKILGALIFAISVAAVYAADANTPDVKKFIDQADTCIHLSGELDGTKTREQQRLVKKINKQCAQAKRQFKELNRKYARDSQVQAILDQYQDDLAD